MIPEREDKDASDQGRDTLVIDPGIGIAVILATDLGSGGGIVDPMKGEGGAGHGNGGGVTQGRGVDHAIEGSGQEIVLGREAGGISHGPERGEIGQDPEKREIGPERGEIGQDPEKREIGPERGEIGQDPEKREISLEAGEGSPDQTSSYCNHVFYSVATLNLMVLLF